jgi:hypothetical protein
VEDRRPLGVRRSDGAGSDGMPKGLVLKDEATVVLERATGLPLRLEHRREVAMGTASSSNHWAFEKCRRRRR